MDRDNIGNFIKEQRNKVNMTQQELADRLNITRENLSKWERGLAVPNTEYLEPLCKALHISITELLSGKSETDSNRFIISLFDKNIKQKRRFLKIIILTILLFILAFLTYYFIDNYNSIKLYTFNQHQDGIFLDNSLLLVVKNKGYFIFNDIEVEDESNIKKITIYYLDDDEKKILYTSDKIQKVFRFNINNQILNNILENSYIEIETSDKTIKTRFQINKRVSNTDLFKNEIIKNDKSETFTFNDYDIPNLEKFTYDPQNDIYKYEDDILKVEYSKSSKALTIFNNYNNNYEKISIIGKNSNLALYNANANTICYYDYVEQEFKNKNCEMYEERINLLIQKYNDFIQDNA